ncbi:MAG: YggT family protein [Syntrophomonadaceae bacterium]
MIGFLIQIVNIAFSVLIWLVIIRCLLSFIPHNPYQSIIRFVYEITEPIMAPFRRVVPLIGNLDLSPFVVVLVLEIARQVIIRGLIMIISF